MLLLEPDSKFVTELAPSPNHYDGYYERKSPWVVLHTMETPENSTVARNIATGWFSRVEAGTSAHYVVGDTEIFQCVNEGDYAWAAMTTGNAHGIHIEMAGRASQGRNEWFDDYSRTMLELVAALTADICARHGIPVRILTDAQLAAGEKGITSHAAISRVFRESDHTDPGYGFPWDYFLERVQAHRNGNASIANGAPPAPAAQQAAPAQSAGPTPLPNGVRYPARGWFTADRRLEVSADTEVDSPALGYYLPGTGFNYDGYVASNGYVWLSYVSWGGARRYIAAGPNDGRSDTVWGTGF